MYRVGRTPEVWAWPDWSYARPDGTFGGRYDDPRGEYRVLYGSSQRFGAFVEALAPYRAAPAVVSGRREIATDEQDRGLEPGTLPLGWVGARAIGEASLTGAFAQVGHSRSLRYLRERLADEALASGIAELDAAAIRQRAPRALTQSLSRLVFECTEADGSAQFAGVSYRSRLGDEITNWAVFERAEEGGGGAIGEHNSSPIGPDDPELVAALQHLGIELA
jgi:hypothetical protein